MPEVQIPGGKVFGLHLRLCGDHGPYEAGRPAGAVQTF